MAAAEQLDEPLRSDKIPEKEFALLVGTTKRALEGKRQRGVIPRGVWNEYDGKIYYSFWRYEKWLESQWECPPALSLPDSPSGFASPGSFVAAKPSPIPKRQRALKRPQIFALQ